jgi:hypothetical protein
MEIATTQLVRCPIQLSTVRKETLEYTTLRESMRQYGQLVPLIVREASGRLEVVDGQARLEVALDERIGSLTCKLLELTDQEVEVIQLIVNKTTHKTENLARRLARIMRRDKDQTINTLAHLVKEHPDWVIRTLGLKTLTFEAQEMVRKDSLPAAVVFELAKLPPGVQDTLLDSYGLVPTESFIDVLQEEVRNLRSGNRDARREKNQGRRYRFRNLKEVIRELTDPTVAASILSSEGAKTALDGWLAALRWVLRCDLASIAKNFTFNKSGESYE